MNMVPTIKLHLFFARDNSRAVILRQGPSKRYRMILWDRQTNRFEDGQWLDHKVYVERCNLSPDGKHFIYFALDGRWRSEGKGSYSAISRPPYFTALALFPQGHTWGGGGSFIDNAHYIVAGEGDIIGRASGLKRIREYDDRLRQSEKAEQTTPSDRFENDLYHTEQGRLYLRKAQELTLIRDFTDMAFTPIRAPYDWREADHPIPSQSPRQLCDGDRS
ncbi:hypothetical protein SAMN05444414_11841 [Roseovarius marisflavi]|mgnify:CR=1 FL=1|uniref:Uncharacterized protein n=1 Tax=Roseovarius marisflavi TaxID=1054996 RepID=A0A1M7BH39_9RHOB|nr:hypothetical protein [Roseovarius marisflavi]SHL54300.1 hypothetical protein SAMN05444414_11841 [Roseovarius marisflavi]